MIYLFLDADDYLFSRRLSELKAAMGDPEMADLNVTELTANQTSAADILYHAGTMPFLAERRLVIVWGYLSQLDKRMGASKGTESAAHTEAARIFGEMGDLPASNDLVFVESSIDKRRQLWKGFSGEKGTIPGLAELIVSKQVTSEEMGTPDVKQINGWIARTAKEQGIAIDSQAVQMLANFVGPNLRQQANELEKLSLYAHGRPISAADVRLLVSDSSEGLIWDLTDALSQRDGRKAMRSLHDLRRGDANPFYLLTMMARQYRILIKVKDAVSRGGGNENEIAREVKESPYPVKKAMQQCRGYRMDELEAVLDRLLRADFAMKTGADPETELEILVAELTQTRAR
ncbi:MAG: DNA polymerase III subunit delta [Caldilineaceae bacterium]|nr:DNA polymerase III subunit delta [Caldilineaceae bacterium]HRJ42018.1 DNA polymerase III subunit delta [Caldilineaceae bacterium]